MFDIPRAIQKSDKEFCFKNISTRLEFQRAFKALELFIESKDKAEGIHFRFKETEIYYVYQTSRSIKVVKK